MLSVEEFFQHSGFPLVCQYFIDLQHPWNVLFISDYRELFYYDLYYFYCVVIGFRAWESTFQSI